MKKVCNYIYNYFIYFILSYEKYISLTSKFLKRLYLVDFIYAILDRGAKSKKDPKKILDELQQQEEKLKKIAETDSNKAKELKEKMAWKNILQKAEGDKVKDDPTLLKKSIKKMVTINLQKYFLKILYLDGISDVHLLYQFCTLLAIYGISNKYFNSFYVQKFQHSKC